MYSSSNAPLSWLPAGLIFDNVTGPDVTPPWFYPVVIGIPVSTVFLLVVGVVIRCRRRICNYCRNLGSRHSSIHRVDEGSINHSVDYCTVEDGTGTHVLDDIPSVGYYTIKDGTGTFAKNRIIGEGHFGTVYKVKFSFFLFEIYLQIWYVYMQD